MYDRIVYACSGTAPDEAVLDLNTFKTEDKLLSPLYTSVIPMDGNFHRDVFIEGFIQNLMHWKALISVGVWRKVIDYCRDDFSESMRIRLQLMLTLSKADPTELQKLYKVSYSKWLQLTLPTLADINNCQVDSDRLALSKFYLTQPNVIESFCKSLACVFPFSSDIALNSVAIVNCINNMSIYWCNAKQLVLRGASLINGVFINTTELLAKPTPEMFEADYITHLIHETAHYLVRHFANNFNLFSPLSAQDNPNIDKEPLDYGRLTELAMFDCQPDWKHSDNEAARQFLDDIRNNCQIPFTHLRVAPRMAPSLSYGIDVWLRESPFD